MSSIYYDEGNDFWIGFDPFDVYTKKAQTENINIKYQLDFESSNCPTSYKIKFNKYKNKNNKYKK